MAKLSTSNVDIVLQNLLPNSQFSAWSDGTIENVGSDLITNGGFDSDTSDWTNLRGNLDSVSGGQSGNCLQITGDGVTHVTGAYAWQGISPLTPGKLYKMEVYAKAGTSKNMRMGPWDSELEDWITYKDTVVTDSWQKYFLTFEAGEDTDKLWIGYEIDLADEAKTIFFDSITLYEVTPGCVAGDYKACDGWGKEASTNHKIFRSHSDGNTEVVTKLGSFYAMKVVNVTSGLRNVGQVLTPIVKRLAGRTVTMGVWAKTDTASFARLYLSDGSAYYSNYHTGGDTWEWLEITLNVADDATVFYANLHGNGTATVYWSQPMLVFGSSIGEGNYSQKPTDPPTLTGLESLEKSHGKAYVWDKDAGMVVENRPLQNLITNSGFEIWSNSTLAQGYGVSRYNNDVPQGFAVGNNLITGDGNEEGTWAGATGTTPPDGWSLYGTPADYTVDGSGLKITVADSVDGCYKTVDVTPGKLYKFAFTYKNTAGDRASIYIYDVTNAVQLYNVNENTLTDNTSQTSYSVIVEAPANCISMRFGFVGDSTNDIVWINNAGIYEVQPGCAGANVLGPDGWAKTSGGKNFREHNGANTKNGSFYSLKLDAAGANASADWPLTAINSLEEHYLKFRGKTVTLGVWAKTTGDIAQIYIFDSDGNTQTDHTGSDDWEWLEITRSISPTTTKFNVSILSSTGFITYYSQPMLVFGSSIGEGNYSKPPGEEIWLENTTEMFTDYNGDQTYSNGIHTDINVEAQLSGKIGKGIKAICLDLAGEETTVGDNKGYIITPDSNNIQGISIYPQVNNIRSRSSGWVRTDLNGDIYFYCLASGSDSLSGVKIYPLAVQLI